MSFLSPVCLLIAFMGLCWGVGVYSGENRNNRKEAGTEIVQVSGLRGKRGNNDELKKDQSGSAGAASSLSLGKFKQSLDNHFMGW